MGGITSRCMMSLRDTDGRITIRDISRIHNLTDPDEQARILSCGGFIQVTKIHPAVPAVPRVFANAECTRGGLAMARSLGDQLIHKYGVISTPSVNVVTLTRREYADCDVLILLGSDGLLSYMDKKELLACFRHSSGSDIQVELQRACETAQSHLLRVTGNVYADDTSGIAIHVRLYTCLLTEIVL